MSKWVVKKNEGRLRGLLDWRGCSYSLKDDFHYLKQAI